MRKQAKRPAALTQQGSTASRVKRHREKMKAAGLKPVTIWVPDVKSPEVQTEIQRQCALINADAESQRVMEDMLALADFSDWK